MAHGRGDRLARGSRASGGVYFWLTIAWAGLFFLRLAVELPLYLAERSSRRSAPLKLVMGLPLFAPLVAVTWLAVRALYPRTKD